MTLDIFSKYIQKLLLICLWNFWACIEENTTQIGSHNIWLKLYYDKSMLFAAAICNTLHSTVVKQFEITIILIMIICRHHCFEYVNWEAKELMAIKRCYHWNCFEQSNNVPTIGKREKETCMNFLSRRYFVWQLQFESQFDVIWKIICCGRWTKISEGFINFVC